jgi:hypothetical protein
MALSHAYMQTQEQWSPKNLTVEQQKNASYETIWIAMENYDYDFNFNVNMVCCLGVFGLWQMVQTVHYIGIIDHNRARHKFGFTH